MKSNNVNMAQESIEIKQLRERIAVLEKSVIHHKDTEKSLRSLVFIDELTGLYNRNGFFSMVEKQFKAFIRNKTKAIVLFADVDYLKHINDSFGHQEGDHAIVDAANILRQTFRESEIIGRLGGDEFAALAAVSDLSVKEKLLIRLKQKTRAFNEANKRAYKIALSTGVVNYDPGCQNTIEELLDFADKFMYTHKRERKSKTDDKAFSV